MEVAASQHLPGALHFELKAWVARASCGMGYQGEVGSSIGPPALGEHTETALKDWLRLTNDEISTLKAGGVV